MINKNEASKLSHVEFICAFENTRHVAVLTAVLLNNVTCSKVASKNEYELFETCLLQHAECIVWGAIL